MNWTLPKERRLYPRLELGGTVTMVFSGRGATGALMDISVAGVSLRTDTPPGIGERVVLHITGLGRYEAEVQRIERGRVAMSFAMDSQEQWNLVKKLARLLA